MKNKEARPKAGFRNQDEYLLIHDYVTRDPQIQLFTAEDLEDEEPELRKYYCVCKSRLDYLQGADEWFCNSCGQHYDIKIQDVPIKDINESRVKLYPELEHRPVYDDLDVNTPFVEGIDVDSMVQDSEDIQLISSTHDNRIQRIRVKGNLADAIAAEHKYE